MIDSSASLEMNKKMIILILFFTLILGTGLRVYKLGFQSMWTDEIMGSIISQKSILKILTTHEENPPLGYILIHLFTRINNSDFMVRLPSAIFGIMSIFLIYCLGKLLFDVKIGLISAFLMSISIYHIMYSQEGRPYSALIFFSLLSFYCLWRFFVSYDKRYWIGFILATVLGLYTSFFLFFVLFNELLIVGIILIRNFWSNNKKIFFDRINKKILKLGILSIVLIFILFSPLLPRLIRASYQDIAGGRVDFNLLYFKNLFCRYGIGNGLPFYIFTLAFVCGIFSFFGNKKNEIIALFLWLILPFLILTNINLKHFFHIRYVIFTFPIYLIIVSKGLDIIFNNRLTNCFINNRFFTKNSKFLIHFILIIVIFGSLSILPLKYYYSLNARMEDWKNIARYIAQNAKSDTIIFVESSHCIGLIKYYLGEQAKKINLISTEGDIDEFKKIYSISKEVWYVENSPVFDEIVNEYFKKKIVFTSVAFKKLGERELIDWENSWFAADNIRRYYPTVYLN